MTTTKETVALQWLSNPVVIWGGGILLIAGATYFFLPALYSGAKAGAKTAFNDLKTGVNDVIDSGMQNTSDIIGAGTNLPNQGALNEIRQTVAPGGRGLSDFMDFIGLGN